MAAKNITPDYDKVFMVPFLKNGTAHPDFVEHLIRQVDISDFDFERSMDLENTLGFLQSTWILSLFFGAIYLGGVFYLQHFMQRRKPLELKGILVSWNIAVGLFSLFGFWRATPELVKFIGRPNGFYESMCIPNFTSRYAFWAILFSVSKVPELIDTVFVVLRKKPLEGVQWYHHLVTVIGCWTFVPYFEPCARYMVVINFGVHGIMYPYFALKVAGVHVPRIVAKVITTCQFTQMVVCLIVNLVSACIYLTGTNFCHRHPLSVLYALLVNVSFIIMFGNLFVKIVVQSTRVSRNRKTA